LVIKLQRYTMKIVSYYGFLIIAKSLAHNQELKNQWGVNLL